MYNNTKFMMSHCYDELRDVVNSTSFFNKII